MNLNRISVSILNQNEINSIKGGADTTHGASGGTISGGGSGSLILDCPLL